MDPTGPGERRRFDDLENDIVKARGVPQTAAFEREEEKRMARLRELHSSIIGNVDHVQEQTARILQEQERDLLRAFRARLFDLQAELEKEKARAEDGAAVWIEKNRQLQKELDWSKEMSERLDRQVQTLTVENERLRTQYKTQEEDREYLIKQLVRLEPSAHPLALTQVLARVCRSPRRRTTRACARR